MPPKDSVIQFQSLKVPPPYEQRVLFVCVKRAQPIKEDNRYGRRRPVSDPATDPSPPSILRTGILKSTGKLGHNFQLDNHVGPSGYNVPVSWAEIPWDLPVIDDVPTPSTSGDEEEADED